MSNISPPKFTVVEPSATLLDYPEDGKYLEFLEKCARVCYKSEENICEGSAEKLLKTKILANGHLSVLEHLGMILKFSNASSMDMDELLIEILDRQPLFRFSTQDNSFILSGNIRMWHEFLSDLEEVRGAAAIIAGHFKSKYPLFWATDITNAESHFCIELLDDNPFTNKNNLSVEDMMRHMRLSVEIVTDRSIAQQITRHRQSFSMESQRYVNFSKKGNEYIKPAVISTLPEELQFAWEEHVKCGFKLYGGLMREGKIKPEVARSLLSNCCKTKLIETATLESWKHMIEERAHNPLAQEEIRNLFISAEEQLHQKLPKVF